MSPLALKGRIGEPLLRLTAGTPSARVPFERAFIPRTGELLVLALDEFRLRGLEYLGDRMSPGGRNVEIEGKPDEGNASKDLRRAFMTSFFTSCITSFLINFSFILKIRLMLVICQK